MPFVYFQKPVHKMHIFWFSGIWSHAVSTPEDESSMLHRKFTKRPSDCIYCDM